MRRALPLALILLAPLAGRAQENDFTKIKIAAEKVAGNVYMLSGVGGFAGGNIGVQVGPDGVVLVDDQYEPMVPKIQAALRGITDKPVRYVLHTHYHSDHVNGDKVFGLKSTIIAQENARKRIVASTEYDDKPGTRAPRHALPVITFDNRVSVHLNDEEIRGVHLPPGHTDGDVVVFFTRSNVVHLGDDFFNGLFPFIDFDGGGSMRGYLAAIEKALADIPADAKIIPGHGKLATRADLVADLAMLKDAVAIIDKGIRDGKTVEQLQKEKVLAKYDKWAWPVISTDQFIAEVYTGLKGPAKKP